MGYHPRIETTHVASFQTTRTQNSLLWFVNNRSLEDSILGYAAKYATRYGVRLYALAIEGNHIQFPALFPKANRAHFMRDLNSSVARAVRRCYPNYQSGRLWARRYSAEYLPDAKDIEEQFFYTVLQPVQDGLVDNIYDYPGYNCFEDAITGTTREFKVVRWKEFNDAARWNRDAKIEDFTDSFQLKYDRLPGYEGLSTLEYSQMMRRKLRDRIEDILSTRASVGGRGREYLKRVTPGALPKSTKLSTRYSHRPRVLSKDPIRRKEALDWYFTIYYEYREKSALFRAGEPNIVFPPGTYKPPVFTKAAEETWI